MFTNVSKFTIILVWVPASIALLSILCSYDETGLFAKMIARRKNFDNTICAHKKRKTKYSGKTQGNTT